MLSGATRPDSGAILLDGSAGGDRRPARRDGARHLHRLPGAEPAAASQRRREHAARPDADARPVLRHRLARGEPHRRRGCSPISASPNIDPHRAGRLPQRRAAADRRDRQGAGRRAAHPDPRRADRGALGRGDRAALRQGPAASPRPAAPRPLHLAPAGGDLRDRRRDRRAQGRRAACWPRRSRELDQDRIDPRHGRPAAVGDLSRARGRARAASCSRSSGSAARAASRT